MLTRRGLLAKALLASAPLALGAFAGPAAAQVEEPAAPEIIRLWPNGAPGGGGPGGLPIESAYGALRNVSDPYLRVFRPNRPNGAVALVAAGGGYDVISMRGEAYPAAEWLAARGVTVFVLAYRLPGENWNCGPICALQDAQRAIRLIRSKARSFRVDPARLMAVGFSAGGHLMGLASSWSSAHSYQPVDAADTFSARPDWSVLVYPVITLLPPLDHTGTRRHMAAKDAPVEELERWSVAAHVSGDCPPTLLVHAADDPAVEIQHSEIMKAALERNGVPVDFIRLPAGGHGFGMGIPGRPSFGWSRLLDAWLRRGPLKPQTEAVVAVVGKTKP